MSSKIVEKDLSFEIMNAAFEVHNQLGPGFLETIYETAMVLELNERGADVTNQVQIPVCYKEIKVGDHILDLVVEGKVILELKAVSERAPIHIQQARSYLKATGYPQAIVINFGASKVESRRIANTLKPKPSIKSPR